MAGSGHHPPTAVQRVRRRRAAGVTAVVAVLLGGLVAAFSAAPVSAATVDTSAWYVLVNRNSGKALDVYNLATNDGARITLITNDHARPAIAIADLYKARWQIELLFRWIKQHLKLKTFLGRSDNAVRLQLFAAMIAFLLLRLAAMAARSALPPLRFADLVRDALFVRKPLDRIDKPPQLNPSKSLPRPHPNQLTFCYA